MQIDKNQKLTATTILFVTGGRALFSDNLFIAEKGSGYRHGATDYYGDAATVFNSVTERLIKQLAELYFDHAYNENELEEFRKELINKYLNK